IALPAVWLLAHWIEQRPRVQRRIVLSALLATSLGCPMLDSGGALVPYEQVKQQLAGLQPQEVWADEASAFPLTFAEGMRPPYRLRVLSDALPPAGTLVVVCDEHARARIEEFPNVTRVVEITPPTTL